MGDHLRAFGTAATDDAALWMQTVDAVYGVIAKFQIVRSSALTGLLPDFVINTNMPNPAPPPRPTGQAAVSPTTATTTTTPPACPCSRWPWTTWPAADGARAKTALTRINEWIRAKTGGNPLAIVDGYRIDTGAALPDAGTRLISRAR